MGAGLLLSAPRKTICSRHEKKHQWRRRRTTTDDGRRTDNGRTTDGRRTDDGRRADDGRLFLSVFYMILFVVKRLINVFYKQFYKKHRKSPNI